MNYEPKVFNKTSFIAAVDQEESWDLSTQKTVARNVRIADIMRAVTKFGIMGMLLSVSAIIFVPSSYPETSLAGNLRTRFLIPSFVLTGAMIVGVNVLRYFTVRTNAADRQHWVNTWGIPNRPKVFCTTDGDSNTVLISVAFDGYEEQPIGYFGKDEATTQYLTN